MGESKLKKITLLLSMLLAVFLMACTKNVTVEPNLQVVEEQPLQENDEDKVSCDNDIDDINGELEEWVGEYTFQESISEPFMFMDYKIDVYEQNFIDAYLSHDHEQITSISYDVDGEIITKTFDTYVKLPGKTIFQLWDEKLGNILVAHNIYSEWYVLIEEDPNVSFEKEGQVYGKLGRTVEMLDQSRVRSIFNPDSPSWENVKIESKNIGIE